MERAGGAACLRASEEPVPGHEGAVQRVQASVPERDAEDAAGRALMMGPLVGMMDFGPCKSGRLHCFACFGGSRFLVLGGACIA